jgi:transcriptional regulator with XRE-family HTH domain
MTFGEKLKELRTQTGLTQVQLAELSGVPLGTIRDYEQGKRDPLLRTALKLAQALNQSLDVFVPQPQTRRPRKAVGAGSKAAAAGGSADKAAKERRSRRGGAIGRERKPKGSIGK